MELGVENVAVENARIVTPDDVVRGSVLVRGSHIAAVGPALDTGGVTRRIDAGGRFLLPGLVDLHGDEIERHLFPRDGARIDPLVALTSVDRANLAAGVTTKFHAVAFEEAPDEHRTIALARELVDAIRSAETLLADHTIHARCELTAPSLDAVEQLVRGGVADLVSVMHHVPGDGQFGDRDRFIRHYVDDRGYDEQGAEQLLETRQRATDDVLDERVRRIGDLAREAGLPLASHDDETPTQVESMYHHGATISEYPIGLAAAKRANALGMDTVMGAPNLVRGGSQWGNLDAMDAINADVLDVLCSDYHPPSLLAAPFVETGEPLPERVARVTSNPAAAAGMEDRGRIESGARADLILVDPDPTPTVERAFVAGVDVYRTTLQNGVTGRAGTRPRS